MCDCLACGAQSTDKIALLLGVTPMAAILAIIFGNVLLFLDEMTLFESGGKVAMGLANLVLVVWIGITVKTVNGIHRRQPLKDETEKE